MRSYRSISVFMATGFILGLCSSALAQTTLVGSGTPQAKPAKVDSYIRTSDGKFLWDTDPGMIANSNNFPKTLNTFPGPTVDVLMQQCFGGGFAPGMNTAITQYTFTSASNWNELAWNTTPAGGAVQNFTNSWNMSFPRTEGLYLHYTDAVSGAAAVVGPPARAAVTADPFGPSGASRNVAKKEFENPVFASPDALAGGNPNPAGANNARDVKTTDTYAILLAPSPLTKGADTPRFQTNIDRIYNSLRGISIPANHIIVLYGSNAANTMTSGGTPINGAATLDNIVNAAKNGAGLYGNITGQTSPGNPDAAAHLFVYTTGHGNSWDQTGAKGKAGASVNPGKSKVDITVDDMPATDFSDSDGSDSGIGLVDIELSSLAPDLAGSDVSINGAPIGTLLPNPIAENDLSNIIGSTFTYTFSVSLSMLDAIWDPGTPLTIGLDNLADPDGYDTLVSAVSFNDYNEDWAVGVVPEPATLGLLSLAGLALLKRRSHRI